MKPRRSILSVPGHLTKMHHKAVDSLADGIMLDLEDSVPLDQKAEARKNVIESLLALDWSGHVVSVRINSLDTPYGYRDLLEVAERAGHMIDSIVVPKVNHPGDIHFADRMLDGIELANNRENPVYLEASIETARGLANVEAIASASSRLGTLVFGIADYSASVNARLVSISGHGENEEEIYPGHRWHFVLSRMIMAAKANDLLAIDAPYGNFKDTSGLEKSALMATALGCDGKWAIHPGQIEGINRVFSPSAADIERARTIIEADRQAQNSQKGAIAVEGRMVDQATIRLARQLWQQAQAMGLIDGDGKTKGPLP